MTNIEFYLAEMEKLTNDFHQQHKKDEEDYINKKKVLDNWYTNKTNERFKQYESAAREAWKKLVISNNVSATTDVA